MHQNEFVSDRQFTARLPLKMNIDLANKTVLWPKVAVLCLLASGAVAQKAPGNPPIFKYSEKGDVAARFTIALRTKGGGFCSSVVIAKDLLLTAAHCVEGPASTITPVFALDPSKPDAPKGKVHSISIHPYYRTMTEMNQDPGSWWFDIALIKLDRPVPANYEPIGLKSFGLKNGYDYEIFSNGRAIFSQDDVLYMSGFGQTETKAYVDRLQAGKYMGSASTQPDYRLKQRSATHFYVSGANVRIVARFDKGESVGCPGSSGGPIWVFGHEGQPFLVGVRAWGLVENSRCAQGSGVWLAGLYDWIFERSQEMSKTADLKPRQNNPGGCIKPTTKYRIVDDLLRIDVEAKNDCSKKVTCLFHVFSRTTEETISVKSNSITLKIEPNQTANEIFMRGQYKLDRNKEIPKGVLHNCELSE